MAAKSLSKNGAELIASFEGFRGRAYNDAAGHATIGFGHLLHYGPMTAAERKLEWSRARALKQLQADAANAAAAVRRHVKKELTQDQFDALVSFVFNVGVGAFQKSTLLRELNAGRFARVPAELMRWDKAGGKELEGLRRRRAAEGALFARKAPRKKPLRAKANVGATHFSWAETKSHDGKAVPLRLRPNAIRLARRLEELRARINSARARHGLPPTGIRILSWYRSPEQNAKVGGARASRHMSADAADISLQEIERLCPWQGGRAVFEALADSVFKDGGFGQYPGGNRHVDVRGFRARWSSWTR